MLFNYRTLAGMALLAIVLGTTACQTELAGNTSWPDSGDRQLVIGGVPSGVASVNSFYEFQPAASDPNGDRLLFSIVNKPSWAAFDGSSGNLSGYPDTRDAGVTAKDIVITVTDGQDTARLAPFSITVESSGSVPVTTHDGGPVPPAGYRLYFHDEFNDNSGAPDPNFWDYNVTNVINNELQCYTDNRRANVRVENRSLLGETGGYLVLEARKENWSCQQDPTKSYGYTSGSVTTRVRSNGDYLVGRTLENQPEKGMPFGLYEIRAKIPSGRGTWPALWLLGHKKWSADDSTSIGWPSAGEVDIMEAVGFEEANGLYRFHSTLHRSKSYEWPDQRGRTGQGMVHELDERPSARFHVWKMLWKPDSIEFFVDDVRVRKMEVADNDGETVVEDRNGFHRFDAGMNADTSAAWPFSKELGNEFKLILNLAYGGGWGGQQGIDDSIFLDGPVEMLVDYVRVYTEN